MVHMPLRWMEEILHHLDPRKTVLIGVSAKSDGAGFPPATIPLPNSVPTLTS